MIRKIFYLPMYYVDLITNKKPDVLVICYHSVADDEWGFSISRKVFEKQINYLKSKKYNFISVQELEKYLNGEIRFDKPSVLLTFDDGYKNILTVVRFLNEQKIKPLLFVNYDRQNIDRSELGNSLEFLSNEDLKILTDNGWSIGSHGLRHLNYLEQQEQVLAQEVVDSKKHLEQATNTSVNYFSYPKGIYNEKIIELVKLAGYKLAFSMDDAVMTKNSNKYALPRIGVDKYHTLKDFRSIITLTAINVRSVIKKLCSSKFLRKISCELYS